MKAKSSPQRQSGIALVIVLAMLVLLSGLLVAFMSTVTAERNSAGAAAAGATARQIADDTVNLVIAQIREATTRYSETASWASQPGAIRVFSGRTGSRVTGNAGSYQYGYDPGSKDWVYKLYSSDHLKVKSEDFTPTGLEMKLDIEVIESWTEDPEKGYVDLNEPILIPRPDLSEPDSPVVEPRYPIIDPRAAFNETGAQADSRFGIVKGFEAVTFEIPGATRIPTNEKVPILPMPVQWMYVLRDGSILGPEAIEELGAELERNPIVGRTAFWTDDETCKVNLNTASVGTFWDTPSVSTEQESGRVQSNGSIYSTQTSLSLGAAQPSRGEVQRYGGHPATTSLTPILGWMWKVPDGYPSLFDRNLLEFKEAIYGITPFTPRGQGTSRGGTDNADPDRPDGKGMKTDGEDNPRLDIATKHLYANTDEFIFQAQRTTGGTSPDALVNGDKKLKPEDLEKLRFFLTANSRAPELNLFGRPRVTFWPVVDIGESITVANVSKRTNFDNLFAFTSTVGNQRFFFTRANSRSGTFDISLPQNERMLTYLQWVTGDGPTEIPGYGGNFKQKLEGTGGDGERDQLLVEIFDYMRAINLVDTGTTRIGSIVKFVPYTPFFGLGQAGYGTTFERSFDWSGQVTPSETQGKPLKPGLKGLGRFPVIQEAALIFTRAGVFAQGTNVQDKMQAVLVLQMASTMTGYPALRETFWTNIRPVPSPTMVVNNEPPVPVLPLPETGSGWINIANMSSHEIGFGRAFMPTLGFHNQLHFYPEHRAPTNPDTYPQDPLFNTTATLRKKAFQPGPNNVSEKDGYRRQQSIQYYPYVSPLVNLGNAPTFNLEGGTFEVEIYAGESPDDPKNSLVQTVRLNFPSATLPVPEGIAGTRVDFDQRFNNPTKDNNRNVFNNGRIYKDTVRALEFVGTNQNGQPLSGDTRGDLRLASAKINLPESAYQPRGGITRYQNATIPRIHGIQEGHGEPMEFFDALGSGLRGRLAPNATHRSSKPPLLPLEINGVKRSDGGTGDWDRGLSKHMDGAFGNKADEGNIYFEYGVGDNGYRIPYFRGRGIEEVGQSFFTPNRQIPSAVTFGSLPTGVVRGQPWQTLLFRPDRTTGPAHPGARILPEDHLLLDLFTLPTVEPYAISEPFSTAGKINLNYIIAPFGYAKGKGTMPDQANRATGVPNSYLRRDTGLRAVLEAVKMMAVPTNANQGGHDETPTNETPNYRLGIDMGQTIARIEERLQDPNRGLFRSASEICTVDLYPMNPNNPNIPFPVGNWGVFWDQQFGLTGDNMRERPYAHIYPRVTTKSNTFTVHMRCQTIKQSKRKPGDSWEFNPKKDEVVGEYRGSALIERFVDPNDPDLKDYDYRTTSLDPFYRFRVISTKQFSPQ